MTKKELARLEYQLRQHCYKKWQPYDSQVHYRWRKTIDNDGNVNIYTEYLVWDNSASALDNSPCEVEATAVLSVKKNGFKVKAEISSRENLDILQLESSAYSLLNLYKEKPCY